MYILEKTDKLLGKSFFYVEQPVGTKNILFMHGKSYNSKDFLKLNVTLENLSNLKYKFYAFDFPGFGRSEPNNVDPVDFIKAFVDKLNLKNIVLVGVSISGGFALKYAAEYPDDLKAVVAAAPALIEDKIKNFSEITVPVSLMWGEKDDKVNPAIGEKLNKVIPNSELHIFKDLGHPFYFENEKVFKSALLKFLKKIG